ncbi:hypothetical protein [Lysobacter sp. Root494]|jgi:hypothetical protein|uniref:hypothetical protein n=1 Tax=Lysobacter sp. Root494 TaxID=1736549 RepID=UPI0006F3F5C0|nr:hypothetical protein [Lysobacter sp. Root494]KQY52559.1 hypothetical protein ASD14_08165 [Lysobacter sp. Root494]
MNRKLRHTLSALSASGAALAIALMVAVPAGMNQELPRQAMAGQHADELGTLAGAVALSAEIAAASAMAMEADQGMEATQRAPRKGTRHRRQTIVMPYFSFLPRG